MQNFWNRCFYQDDQNERNLALISTTTTKTGYLRPCSFHYLQKPLNCQFTFRNKYLIVIMSFAVQFHFYERSLRCTFNARGLVSLAGEKMTNKEMPFASLVVFQQVQPFEALNELSTRLDFSILLFLPPKQHSQLGFRKWQKYATSTS